jgi:hypothetical protein
LDKYRDEELLFHVSATIGSFACGSDEEIRQEILKSGVLKHLFELLSSSNTKLLENSLRTLYFFFSYRSSSHSLIRVWIFRPFTYDSNFCKNAEIDVLVKLIQFGSESIASLAASLLASFRFYSHPSSSEQNARISEFQEAIAAAGGVEAANGLLASPNSKVMNKKH